MKAFDFMKFNLFRQKHCTDQKAFALNESQLTFETSSSKWLWTYLWLNQLNNCFCKITPKYSAITCENYPHPSAVCYKCECDIKYNWETNKRMSSWLLSKTHFWNTRKLCWNCIYQLVLLYVQVNMFWPYFWWKSTKFYLLEKLSNSNSLYAENKGYFTSNFK